MYQRTFHKKIVQEKNCKIQGKSNIHKKHQKTKKKTMDRAVWWWDFHAFLIYSFFIITTNLSDVQTHFLINPSYFRVVNLP